MAKKIAPAKVEKEKKERKAKQVFKLADALNADLTAVELENGKLTAVPSNFPYGKVKPLGKSDFANGALFFDFQAEMCGFRLTTIQEKLDGFRTKATNARKYKDDASRKRANKIDKLAKMLKELKAEQDAEEAA
jgi:hypothetical protein